MNQREILRAASLGLIRYMEQAAKYLSAYAAVGDWGVRVSEERNKDSKVLARSYLDRCMSSRILTGGLRNWAKAARGLRDG